MLTQSDWEPIVRLALEETNKAIDRLVDRFAPKLQAWLDDILNNPIPEDWRDDLAAFVQRTADDDNLAIAPHSIATLEELIESCIAGTDDFAEYGPASRGPARGASSRLAASVATEGDTPPAKPQPLPPLVGYPDIPVGRRGPAVNAERLFDRQLASARVHFNTLQQLLEAAGEKIDAAKPGEEADVGYEAEMIQKHLFLYNEDLAVARDLWLRFNLSGDANSRLDAMPLPVALGLPPFATQAQAQRMGQQLAAVNRRLRGENASMDALVTTVSTVELAANAASIVAGAGALIVVAKREGTWAVVKMATVGYAIYMDTKIAEAGLQEAGASEQTIRGIQLAAAVITLILLRRVPKTTTSLPPLRQAYIREVEALKDTVAELRAAGRTPEEIARTVSKMRRDLGIKYKDLTPPDKLAEFYARNEREYGDKLGPTIEWFRERNFSWQEIIEKASRPGGADLGLGKRK